MKTAVKWLEELIECGADLDVIKKVIPRAKEMEKQQLIDAVEWNYKSNMGEVYYKSTFNK